jgi:hypothetical protein
MVYDANDRARQAAALAKQQYDEISPIAGSLGTDIEELVKSDAVDHRDKVKRILSMREIATGQSAAVLHGMDETGALEVLQASDLIDDSTKKGLERAFLDENDPRHIGFDDDGTPEEVLRGHDRITELEGNLDNYVAYVEGPIRDLLDQFAAVLGLGPVDNETTEDLRERIQVAIANGAQPTNQIPAPQATPTTGSNPQPAPAPTTPPAPAPQPQATPTTGSNPQPAQKGRLRQAAAAANAALKGKQV